VNPRLFYAQCQAHNWGWRTSQDMEQQSEGYTNEHRLATIAAESEALSRIFFAIQQDRAAQSKGREI